jgi:tRNA A37 threonylcarbamoyladenosine modification protein TsaB
MYLAISATDISYAVFCLFPSINNRKIGNLEQIKTSPEGTLFSLLDFMSRHGIKITDLDGIVVVTGPGSVTAIRSGLSVVNTFSFVAGVPLYPIRCVQGCNLESAIQVADLSDSKICAIPFYDREPNITSAK